MIGAGLLALFEGCEGAGSVHPKGVGVGACGAEHRDEEISERNPFFLWMRDVAAGCKLTAC